MKVLTRPGLGDNTPPPPAAAGSPLAGASAPAHAIAATHVPGLVDELAAHLAPDLAAVDRHIRSVLESDTGLVREVGEYVRSTQGKRLRPMLTMLAARACGYQPQPNGDGDHAKVAAALELVHTATLLHDDVIDKAPLRRARPTVNARWGDDVAILIGDYLYTHAFNLAMTSLPAQVLSLVCQVTAKMCEGELFQIEKRDARLTREDYLRIVRSKTAYLFSACAGLGGVLAEATEEKSTALALFGADFGVAFQISDDALDMASPDDSLGKLHGTDIRNGKQTLPLILALDAAQPAEREALWDQWREGAHPEQLLQSVIRLGGVQAALAEARSYAHQASERLAILPSSTDADYLRRLAEYVVDRQF